MNKRIKIVVVFVLLLSRISANAQDVKFKVVFSEPLAVFQFVDHLSANTGNNGLKRTFNTSAFNNEKYKQLIVAYDKLTTDYSYEYTAYPYSQKIGGSTASLLQKNLINCNSIDDFKTTSLGIIPNVDLFALCDILKEFTPVYRQLIYTPNKDKFEQQLADITKLIVEKSIAAYFQLGAKFYNASWDNTIPFKVVLYPLPNSKGFTATAFYNNAVSAIPTTLTDYNKLLSVILHETFHILFDEQSLAFKKEIEKWFVANPSKNSRYAYLLMNEALATSLGNGYVYGKLNGTEDTAAWYHRKYTSLIAKKIYPW